MFTENLTLKLAMRYSMLDSEILSHANNYYLTASVIYETLDENPHSLYPLLTLLGFSSELFLKAFSVDVDEIFCDATNLNGVMLKKTVTSFNKNSHHLGRLLNHYRFHDEDLYCYLTSRYADDTGRDLQEDLSHYSMVFERVRYIFEYDEYEKRKYSSDVSVLFHLVESLYKSVMVLSER